MNLCDPHLTYDTASVDNRRVFGPASKHETTHPNEDASRCVEDLPKGWNMYAVFDGHDGDNAVKFFENSFSSLFTEQPSEDSIRCAFKNADATFFASHDELLHERSSIADKLKGLNSYEAYTQHPYEVQRLQEIDKDISGGTTAAVVLINTETYALWAANVGDSRILIFRHEGGQHELLSVDHTTSNEAELERLQELGLDKEELAKNGRLGSCENTRSLGDYCLKQGYKEVDSLQHAKNEPGLAEPHVKGPITLEPLDIVVLMTDGVYNSMEIICGSKDPSVLKELLESANYCAKQVLTTITDSVYKMYEENIDKSDAESQAKAQLARKHDDMTLSVIRYQCKFETSF